MSKGSVQDLMRVSEGKLFIDFLKLLPTYYDKTLAADKLEEYLSDQFDDLRQQHQLSLKNIEQSFQVVLDYLAKKSPNKKELKEAGLSSGYLEEAAHLLEDLQNKNLTT